MKHKNHNPQLNLCSRASNSHNFTTITPKPLLHPTPHTPPFIHRQQPHAGKRLNPPPALSPTWHPPCLLACRRSQTTQIPQLFSPSASPCSTQKPHTDPVPSQPPTTQIPSLHDPAHLLHRPHPHPVCSTAIPWTINKFQSTRPATQTINPTLRPWFPTTKPPTHQHETKTMRPKPLYSTISSPSNAYHDHLHTLHISTTQAAKPSQTRGPHIRPINKHTSRHQTPKKLTSQNRLNFVSPISNFYLLAGGYRVCRPAPTDRNPPTPSHYPIPRLATSFTNCHPDARVPTMLLVHLLQRISYGTSLPPLLLPYCPDPSFPGHDKTYAPFHQPQTSRYLARPLISLRSSSRLTLPLLHCIFARRRDKPIQTLSTTRPYFSASQPVARSPRLPLSLSSASLPPAPVPSPPRRLLRPRNPPPPPLRPHQARSRWLPHRRPPAR
uniref:Uncharacterized protein n=1 Tax=Physcomitrium patens TaxID=3218 RepID=A0A2K1L2Y5_PHYPA|nr:hypothetical protein PHYPA_003174 [Physcomitrium patens]